MLEEIFLSQHECSNTDWTLQIPTPTPGNKLKQLVSVNNLTQHVDEITKQNNILDLAISTKEELMLNLKIKYKIEDHQTIQFSIKTEKGNIA